ncbi:MAG: histidine phosphatase family protein [Patescibacteria group bacterium]|nr:histidine phosphatase family protein [Patescibacteria group bacterium]
MVTIIFESHATSIDNEAHRSSGWSSIDLSELGLRQAKELGERYKDEHFDTIFCSDLLRSYKTGEIAFGDRGFPIIQDERLRECDYGDLTNHSSEEVEGQKSERINKSFPNGESYLQTTARMKDFLEDLLKKYDGKKVMIIGHRATQYGLENLILGKPLEEVIPAPWKWQPGWKYKLKNI